MRATSDSRERLAKIPKTANIGATATHSHAFALCCFVGECLDKVTSLLGFRREFEETPGDVLEFGQKMLDRVSIS